MRIGGKALLFIACCLLLIIVLWWAYGDMVRSANSLSLTIKAEKKVASLKDELASLQDKLAGLGLHWSRIEVVAKKSYFEKEIARCKEELWDLEKRMEEKENSPETINLPQSVLAGQ